VIGHGGHLVDGGVVAITDIMDGLPEMLIVASHLACQAKVLETAPASGPGDVPGNVPMMAPASGPGDMMWQGSPAMAAGYFTSTALKYWFVVQCTVLKY
jgi:hypothetical protein